MMTMYRQNDIFTTGDIAWIKDLRITFHKDAVVTNNTAEIGQCLLVSATVAADTLTIVFITYAPVTMKRYRIEKAIVLTGSLLEYHDKDLYLLLDRSSGIVDITTPLEVEPYCVLYDDPPDYDSFSFGVNGTGNSVYVQISVDTVYIGLEPPLITTTEIESGEGLLTFNGVVPTSGNISISGKDLCTVQVTPGVLV